MAYRRTVRDYLNLAKLLLVHLGRRIDEKMMGSFQHNRCLTEAEKMNRQEVGMWIWRLESMAYGLLNQETYGRWEGI